MKKQAQPVHHAVHKKVMTADQAAEAGERGNNDTHHSSSDKMTSEAFTKGRFDSSEAFAQRKHHKKHGHRHAGMTHIRTQKASDKKTAEEEEAEAEAAFEAEKAIVEKEEKAKAAVALAKKQKEEYEQRLASANEFDGLVHTADGKKHFVDDNGAEVSGVNMYAAKKAKHGHKHAKKHHKRNHELVQKPNDKKAAATSEVEEQKKKNAAFEAKLKV